MFWTGIICFPWAGLTAFAAQVSYVTRTKNYFSIFFGGGLDKWKDFTDEEKSAWKRAFVLIAVMAICLSTTLLSPKSDELTLLNSSIELMFPK